MKIRLSSVFLYMLMLVGLIMLNYPSIANLVNRFNEGEILSGLEQSLDEKTEEELRNMKEDAIEYNERLYKETGNVIIDAFTNSSEVESTEYTSLLDITSDGAMGAVEIPKINEFLTIYHGTNTEILEKGIGHLQGTSLPVGGENTHSVLTGHTGLPSAELFTNLDQLKKGDEFYIHILNEVLAYEVDQIKIVEPQETQDLEIEAEEDLVTLLTCTPYGINSHRLMVRGHRVPYVMDDKEKLSGSARESIYGSGCYKRKSF
ncbi:MAG: class C sortase [Suipraeoptans sp.]